MISKLHNGQTLKQELEEVGLPTARLLVTRDEYDDSQGLFYICNDWLADVVSVSEATAKNPHITKTNDKKNNSLNKIFDGYIFPTIFGSFKRINWKTPESDMFVLKIANIKSDAKTTIPAPK